MGIKNLNKYLLQNCRSSIINAHLSRLKNKKIAIDISIYLYNFERNGDLIGGINEMINTFKQYKIIPLFVFDGKPPEEKKYIIQERKKEKEKKQEQIDILLKTIDQYDDVNDCDDIIQQEKEKILLNINKIKRQIIYITYDKIQEVKNIILSNNFMIYDSPKEADELCAMLVYEKYAWACMSEDMDLFVYGCPKIIKGYNNHKSSVKIYNTYHILHELNISLHNFKQICILSGTDYNCHQNNYNLFNVISLYNQYKEYQMHQKEKSNYKNNGFIKWVYNYIDNSLDILLLNKIYEMFNLNKSKKIYTNIFKNINC